MEVYMTTTKAWAEGIKAKGFQAGNGGLEFHSTKELANAFRTLSDEVMVTVDLTGVRHWQTASVGGIILVPALPAAAVTGVEPL